MRKSKLAGFLWTAFRWELVRQRSRLGLQGRPDAAAATIGQLARPSSSGTTSARPVPGLCTGRPWLLGAAEVEEAAEAAEVKEAAEGADLGAGTAVDRVHEDVGEIVPDHLRMRGLTACFFTPNPDSY
mmetsp:Transcript_7056/g.11201  ORF Transcript_7056/g.11201 Transcript_7056/m.11201 type:complete len:128 (-) Transcript_7056:810-1193(-)